MNYQHQEGIQTFKVHFKYILYGVDNLFPLNLRDGIISQTDMQKNLLCKANTTPTASVYAYLNGPHGLSCMPRSLLGCAIQIYEKTNISASWAPHSISGRYLVTSTDHYCCYNVWNKEIFSKRVSDTVYFKHKYKKIQH